MSNGNFEKLMSRLKIELDDIVIDLDGSSYSDASQQLDDVVTVFCSEHDIENDEEALCAYFSYDEFEEMRYFYNGGLQDNIDSRFKIIGSSSEEHGIDVDNGDHQVTVTGIK